MNHSQRRLRLTFALFSLLFSLAFTWLGADIAIYGDTQTSDSIHRQVVLAIAEHKPQIAFHTGDLSSRGSRQKHYDKFFTIEKPLSSLCAIYPARGNHDRSLELFLSNFQLLQGKTYYTVEHDSLLFIILDSTQDLQPRSPQYLWLLQTLKENPLTAKIVILHRPLFSSGFHGGDSDLALILPATFAGKNIIAVFSGHDHDYERSEYQGITYFVGGGGGGMLRSRLNFNPFSKVFQAQHHYLIASRSGKSLTVKAFNLKGEILDQTVLTLP